MPKVQILEVDGEFCKWVIFCPACKDFHQMNDGWEYNGLEDSPTFSPSIMVTQGFGNAKAATVCHSFVTDGKIRYLQDCTHDMAGKVVALPECPELG